MRLTAGCLLAISVSVVALAEPAVYIVPAAPTTQTAITLHIVGIAGVGCPPSNPVAAWHGNDVDVSLTSTIFSPFWCFLYHTTFDVPLFLGLLPAGSYRASVRIDGQPYGSVAFDVAEALPPF